MMKNIIKIIIIATALMLTGATIFAQESVQVESAKYGNNPYNGQSVVTMYNNTDQTVYASFVYFDPIDQCWVSRGWRTLPQHGTNKIDFGVYAGNVYIHGYQPNFSLKWGSGFWFCCEAKAPFRVLHPEGGSCDMKREYSLLYIQAGDNRFEFNP